jgi:RNA polymerase sigma factor (sigma-70 family)
MSHTLAHPLSPLELTRNPNRIRLASATRQLSDRDQAALTAILNGKYETMYDKSFEGADAVQRLFDDACEVTRPNTGWYHSLLDSAGAQKSNATRVILTGLQERTLFLQFNYCRFRVLGLRRQIDPTLIDREAARQLLGWHRKAEAYRDQITNTNLALVLAMAKRTRASSVEFGDLVSEGNMALLRAIDKFDVSRGFKFSTYACRAILKAFSRIGIKNTRLRALFTEFDSKSEKSDYLEKKRQTHEEDCVDEVRLIIRENRANLTEMEQDVIAHRFAVGNDRNSTDSETLTLQQVGVIIGVTKERSRQIQNRALEKIRLTLEGGFLR